MLFAVLVIHKGILMQLALDGLVVYNNGAFPQSIDHQFKDIEQFAGVASAVSDKSVRFLQGNIPLAKIIICGQRPVKQRFQVRPFQGFEHIDLATGKKRGNDLEGRILGGRPDKSDRSFLDGSEKGILLRFGEAMNLVDKQNRIRGVEEPLAFGFLNDLPHLFDSGRDRAQGIKGTLQLSGDNHGKGGFPHSRRSPQDERGDGSGIDHLPQDLARPHQMLLSHIIVQRLGTHPFC